jgi:carbon-monoxide dehydrogenase small subunit
MKDTFRINDEIKTFDFDEQDTLLTGLRNNGHTEVKNGCEEGECGACAVLLDGELVNSCQVLAASVRGRAITTVRGIGTMHSPHPLQESFADAGAIQCGFCTPGMILAAYALLRENPSPSEQDIRKALDGNICRCTGYEKIFEAVRMAAERMRQDD